MLTEYFTANRIFPEARNYLYREFPEHFVWIQQQKAWQPRKKGFSIARIVTASPREGARFCLRVLLNNVKGALSYDDLLVVGNTRAKSIHESCLLRGLLQADNTLQLCLREASFFRMPQSIRCIFATILVYCNPLNPAALWQEFETVMSEDYARLPGIISRNASKRALKDISFLLESMGKRINDYHIVPENINIDDVERGDKEIDDELSIPISGEDLASTLLLNFEQKQAFDIIIQKALSNEGCAFFIDGPGGTGKTYLYKAILAELRSRGFIAIATASSGVAASILPGGRTAHSRFKIPPNADDKVICKVSKQSGLARVLRAAKLIIWDEAPMMRREAIEAFELMLQDVCESESLFGGKVIVFGGDFRQVLPVVPRGTIAQTVDASLVKSHFWSHLEKIKLSENMRAREDPRFSQFLLGIGDGSEASVIDDQIMLPSSMVLPYENESSISSLIDETCPNLKDYSKCIDTMINRAILTPTNELVDNINNTLIEKFEGHMVEYRSFDEPIDESQQVLQEDFFNSMTPSGFPPHILRLKRDCPVILLRNIDPSKGLCNGTRLICKTFGPNVIGAEIAVGPYKGRHVFLPRNPLQPTKNESTTFPFQRTQFPIRLCFAMTINKAQGQTLDFVGIYLPQPVFSHGQLYVALSRAKNSKSVKLLIAPGSSNVTNHALTRNVVYKDVFLYAASD